MSYITLRGQSFHLLLSAQQIAARVKQLAAEVSAHYRDQELHCLVVLKGSFIFAADLVRQLEGWPQVHFAQYASYAGQSSGELRTVLPIPPGLKGKHVLLIEDILDSGKTLAQLQQDLAGAGAASVATAVLLDKPGAHPPQLQADFTGFDIANHFVIGYGLDWDGQGRHLPAIYAQA